MAFAKHCDLESSFCQISVCKWSLLCEIFCKVLLFTIQLADKSNSLQLQSIFRMIKF